MFYLSKDGVAVQNLQCLSQYFEPDKVINAIFTLNQDKSEELHRILLKAGCSVEAEYIHFCTSQISQFQKGKYVESISDSIKRINGLPSFLEFLANSDLNSLFSLAQYCLLNCDKKNPSFEEHNHVFLKKLCKAAEGHTAAEYCVYIFILLYICIEYEDIIPKSDQDRIFSLIKEFSEMPQIKSIDGYYMMEITEDTKLPWHRCQGLILSNVLCKNITESVHELTITDDKQHIYDRTVLLPDQSVWALRSGAGFAYFQDKSNFDCESSLGSFGLIKVTRTEDVFFESSCQWNDQPPEGLNLSLPVVGLSTLGTICCLLHEDGTISTDHPALTCINITNALRVCVLTRTVAVIHQDHTACFYPNTQNQITAPEGKFSSIIANDDTYVGIALDGSVVSNKLNYEKRKDALSVSYYHGQIAVKYADGSLELHSLP